MRRAGLSRCIEAPVLSSMKRCRRTGRSRSRQLGWRGSERWSATWASHWPLSDLNDVQAARTVEFDYEFEVGFEQGAFALRSPP